MSICAELFGLVTQTVRQQSLHFITDRNGEYLYRPDAPEAFTVAAGNPP